MSAPGAPAEYRAAREAAALADLGDLAKLAFRGPDRRKFLQGLVTSDVLALQPGRGQPSCVLTPKGRLVADFALYDRGEDLLALCRPQAGAAMRAALEKMLLLGETSIEDLSASWAALLILGPRWAEALAAAGLSAPSEPYFWKGLVGNGGRMECLSYPLFGPEGKLLLVPAEQAQAWRTRLLNAGRSAGLALIGGETLETLRLEAGTPLLGVDMDADTLPLEAGLEAAISFTKGCYMGQETTSRIKNLGHVNRRLVGLKLAAVAARGAEVAKDGVPVGRVTSSAPSPRLDAALALAMVRAEHARPGAALMVVSDGGEAPAQVVRLPL